MKKLNSHLFEDVYKKLNIDLDELGCIMLDIEPVKGVKVQEDWFYYTTDKKKFWIDGYVFDKVAHLTLLYGLLDNGHNWENHVEAVLKDWKMDTVEVESIGYFDSPYKNEPYYCIVAHIKMTDELMEGHQRLEFLPHINTFNGYKPHVTIAYVKKDEQIRDNVIRMFENMVGYKLPVKSLNLGDKPKAEMEKDKMYCIACKNKLTSGCGVGGCYYWCINFECERVGVFTQAHIINGEKKV